MAYTIDRPDPEAWSTCSLTGELQSPGLQTGTWNYSFADDGAVMFSFTGGLGIFYKVKLDPQYAPLGGLHLNDNPAFVINEGSIAFFPIRWERQ